MKCKLCKRNEQFLRDFEVVGFAVSGSSVRKAKSFKLQICEECELSCKEQVQSVVVFLIENTRRVR